MYIYTYTYIFVYMCVCVFTYIYKYVYIYICVHIYIYIGTHLVKHVLVALLHQLVRAADELDPVDGVELVRHLETGEIT